jgi:hypothetical protein
MEECVCVDIVYGNHTELHAEQHDVISLQDWCLF